MAFDANNLAMQFAGGGGLAKSWLYITTDTIETVIASGYFSGATAANLDIGDRIDVSVVDAVAPSSRAALTGTVRLFVATNDGTTVTTSYSRIVATTATTLTVTAGAHDNKTVVINSTSPIAVTLPQALGTGAKFRFFLGVAATATSSSIKVANATDVMVGFQFTVTTSATNVEGFATSATSDTYYMNGTTLGGIAGDVIQIEDVKTGFFSVLAYTSSTGTEATPFAAAVA